MAYSYVAIIVKRRSKTMTCDTIPSPHDVSKNMEGNCVHRLWHKNASLFEFNIEINVNGIGVMKRI